MNPPRQSATVILLREHAGEVQVLVTLRHANLGFMGGKWVFPGGALSAADGSPGALAILPDTSTLFFDRLHTLHGERLGEGECRALAIAACRETFEETGLLLVRKADGTPCGVDVQARLQAERADVATQPGKFSELLLREDLRLEVERLIYWAHWITPSGMPRRFDTRFFAVAAPDSQTATADLREASDLAWMSPAKLLAAARNDAMPISQPTLYNLEDLAASIRAHPSLAALFANEGRRSVVPILPKLLRESERTMVVMPWDPEYASISGDAAAREIEYPEVLRGLASRQELAH